MAVIKYTEHKLTKELIDEKTRQFICELYGSQYTGNLIVEKLYPEGYKVSIPMLCNETPFSVCIEAEGDKFLQFLKKALQESSLGSVDFYTLSTSQKVPSPVNENIKGNWDTTHRIQQDSITYEV